LDTTPFYSRPEEPGIRNAIQSLFRVIQCVAPKTAFEGPALVRCVMGNKGKITTAEAMWAIHEIARAGGFFAALRKSRPAWISIVTEQNPPAGIQMAEGEIHASFGFPDWADLYFEPVHDKIDDIRKAPIETRQKQQDEKLASAMKLFPQGVPENPDIRDLVLQLNTKKDSGRGFSRIAREFTGEKRGNDKRARSLLAQIRRLRRQGRVVL
jgi:hypothetical protein